MVKATTTTTNTKRKIKSHRTKAQKNSKHQSNKYQMDNAPGKNQEKSQAKEEMLAKTSLRIETPANEDWPQSEEIKRVDEPLHEPTSTSKRKTSNVPRNTKDEPEPKEEMFPKTSPRIEDLSNDKFDQPGRTARLDGATSKYRSKKKIQDEPEEPKNKPPAY